MSSRRLLVVDDDPELRAFVTAVAEGCGFAVREADCFAALCAILDDSAADGLVLDLSLPDSDGIEALRFLASRGFTAPIVIASSFDERLLSTTRRLGESYGLTMAGQMRKPFTPKDLRDLLVALPRSTGNVDVDDLKDALRLGHLGLVYQPKVDIATGTLLGAEALARWNDPQRGTIGPGQFIDLAEQHGLMTSMMNGLLDVAIQACRDWRDHGIEVPVAVNLSASLLGDLTIPDRIAQRVLAARMDPASLILEVTETSAMRDPMASMDVLTRLRIKGFQLSLDDFGTGYSSLVELHRMPFSEIKIDRSFVAPIEADRDARVIVRAIISLGQALGLKVIAEGVETEGQRQILRELGCRAAQGYLFSRPIPHDAFVAWAKQRLTPAVPRTEQAQLAEATVSG
ncbi:MAG: EAL domain-containing response regulator [Alphaproteobacteria bacterium]